MRFECKCGEREYFETEIGNEDPQQDSNDNGVKIIHFAHQKI